MDLGAGRARTGKRPGVALLNAMFFMAIVTVMLISAINFTRHSAMAGRNEKYRSQTYHIARAGLTDAVSWFKRQTTQPVATFNPSPDPSNPPHGDTWDPYSIDPGGSTRGNKNLGIVQEFELSPGLWGRYEVGKLTRLDRSGIGTLTSYYILEPTAGPSYTPVPIAQATTAVWPGVQDVSDAEGLTGTGQAWRLRSHGYVYRRDVPNPGPSTLFFNPPNQVLDQLELETEIRRLALNDYQAALVGNLGSHITFNNGNNVVVDGKAGAGVLYNSDPPPNPNWAPSSFHGSPSVYKKAGGSGNSLGWSELFNVSSSADFASLADFVDTDPNNLPKKMSSMAVTYLKGAVTFNSSRPLTGGGMLVVDGDLTIASGSNSSFTGLIYVTGKLTVNSPCTIAGQVVVKGDITLNSSSSTNNTSISYDSSILNDVRTQLGQYRESRSALRVVS